MAILNVTRIPNLCLQSFRDAVNRCFNPDLTPNMIAGTYRIDTTALWPGFYQPAQQLGMEHQLEGRYYAAYPGLYAVRETPASPEIHILLSNIALPPCGYHLTEEHQYSYDKLIMDCAAMSILDAVLHDACEE